ncbi:ABC transporter substrate-binding protein [Nocardiopsis composta]
MRIGTITRASALAVAVLLTASGCGISMGTGGGQGGGGEVSGAADGSITFQTWNLKTEYADFFEELIDEFEKENPGSQVRWVDQPAEGYADKLSADAAAESLPDVVNVAPDLVHPLARAGAVLELEEARPGAAEAYLPDAWESFAMPGMDGVYAYPWYLNTGPVFYNRELFEQAGLDPDDPPSTFDELFDQALRMAEETGGETAMLGQTPGIIDLGMYGSQLMNGEGTEFTFNDAPAVEMVQRYREMYEAGALVPEALTQDYTGTGEQFMSGALAWAPAAPTTWRTSAPTRRACTRTSASPRCSPTPARPTCTCRGWRSPRPPRSRRPPPPSPSSSPAPPSRRRSPARCRSSPAPPDRWRTPTSPRTTAPTRAGSASPRPPSWSRPPATTRCSSTTR